MTIENNNLDLVSKEPEFDEKFKAESLVELFCEHEALSSALSSNSLKTLFGLEIDI